MDRIQAKDLAEILYQARCGLASKPRGIIKFHLEMIEAPLAGLLREGGYDPGITADDADYLKLSLMDIPTRSLPAPPEPKVKIVNQIIEKDIVAHLLDEASSVSGSECQFRELSRFQEFCIRMRYKDCIPDDPEIPVYQWVRDHNDKAPAADIIEAAKLYLEWTREVCRKFLESRLGVASIRPAIASPWLDRPDTSDTEQPPVGK
jgi:hypothetical protein